MFLWSLPALAQEPRPLDLHTVPQEGQAPDAFVPQGWRIEDTTQGDLNKDDSLDVVLQLVEAGPDKNAKGEVQAHARALLVLLEQGGKLHRVGASNSLLYCTTCAGTQSAVKIDKGILLIEQLSGPQASLRTLRRFRYELKDKRVLFIGQDDTWTERGTGKSRSVSLNRLTGQRITEMRQYDAKKKKEIVVSSKKETVPVKNKLYLEDLSLPEHSTPEE